MSIAGRFIALLAQHHDTPCLFTASRSGAAPEEECGEQRVTEKRITRMHVYLPPYDLTAASVRRRSQRKMRGWVCHGPLGRHACSLLYLPHLPRPEQHDTCSAHGAEARRRLLQHMVSPYRALCGSKCLPLLGCPLRYCPHLALRIMPGAMGALVMRLGAVATPGAYTSLVPHNPCTTPFRSRRGVFLCSGQRRYRRASAAVLIIISCVIPNSCAPRRSPTESQQPLQVMSDQLCASSQPGAMRGRCTKVRTGGEAATGQFLDSAAGGARKAKCIQWNACYDRSSLAHRRAQGARLARQPAPQPNQPPLPGYAYPGSSCREGGGSRDIKGALLQTPRTYSTAPYSPRQGPRF